MSLCLSCYTYAQKTEQGLDTVLQAHIHKLERYLKTILFCYIETHSCYCFNTLLDNSYFTFGSQVFRQCRGASMGSQFEPVLCSAVALQT